MGKELLSPEESLELLNLVNPAPHVAHQIDPQHALVLYALKLIAPIDGDKSKGYAPTKAGLMLASKLHPSPNQPGHMSMAPRHPHQNTDPYWPFPIRIR